jgi:hypothetical protein
MRGGYNALHVAQLVDADPEFAVDVSRGNFCIATCKDVRVDADTYRHAVAIDVTKLFKDADVVNVYVHAILNGALDLLNTHTVWGINDLFRPETCAQPDLYLFNRDGIKS